MLLLVNTIEIFAFQNLSETKKPNIMVELQKLVSEWPLEVIKHQKEENRKVVTSITLLFLFKIMDFGIETHLIIVDVVLFEQELATSLRNGIPAMVNALLNNGLEVRVNMEGLTSKEGILF